MISRSLFPAVLVASSAMAGPPLTTIQDVLYKADGTRFAGTLTISWTSFEAIDKSAIATQATTVTVTGGEPCGRTGPPPTPGPPAPPPRTPPHPPTNTTCKLSTMPNPASSLAVYRNGMLQQLGQDYTLNGSLVQFVAAAVPQPGDTLLASYRLSGSDSGSVGTSVISPQQIDPAGLAAGQAWILNVESYVAA